jgi:hypothetical protein
VLCVVSELSLVVWTTAQYFVAVLAGKDVCETFIGIVPLARIM